MSLHEASCSSALAENCHGKADLKPSDSNTPLSETISDYVFTVCQQIRWKKARPRVADELTTHISDSRDAYLSQGIPLEEATANAISDTGDAAIIGTQLDRVHRPKPQWGMLGTTAALVILGLAIYTFFSGSLSFDRLLFTGIGISGLVAAYFIDFTWLAKYPKVLFFSIASISFVRILMLNRHIYISGLTPARTSTAFDPMMTGILFFSLGDILTLIFPLVLAIVIFYAKSKGYWGLMIAGASFVLLAMFAFSMSIGSGGRFAVIGFIIFGIVVAKDMLKVGRLPAASLIFGPIALIGVFVIFVTNSAIQRYLLWNRIMVVFNPSIDPMGRGFWPMMTRTIIRDAAWFGQGGTEGLSMLFPFTESPPMQISHHSVLTALIGLTGWVSLVIIVGVLLFFIVRGVLRCFRQKSNLGLLVSSAVMLTFTVQVVEYVLFNLGFQMVSPMSLPLVVSSNTALIVNMVLVGFMLSVFRTGDAVVDTPYEAHVGRFISWDDGRLIIDFKSRTGKRLDEYV